MNKRIYNKAHKASEAGTGYHGTIKDKVLILAPCSSTASGSPLAALNIVTGYCL